MSNPPFSHDDLLTESEIPKPPSPLAVLIPLVEEIPLHQLDTEANRGRKLFFRAIVLVTVSVLAYLPCFWGGLLDGERDRLLHLSKPETPFYTVHQIAGWFELGNRVPNLLRILIYAQHGPEGSSPLYQFAGICLHSICVVLLWLVLRRLGLQAAWLAALIFAVHPANVSAVAWVSQQGRLWALLFSLLGALTLFKNRSIPPEAETELADYLGQESSRQKVVFRKTLSYIAACVFFLLAALCQPAAAVVPLVAILLIRWKKRPNSHDLLLLAPLALIFAAATILFLYRISLLNVAPGWTFKSALLNQVLLPPGKVIADGLLLHSTRSPWIDASGTAIDTAATLGALCFLSIPLLIAKRHQIGKGIPIAAICFVILLPTILAPVAVHASTSSMQQIIDPGEGYLCQLPLVVLLATAVFKLSRLFKEDLKRAITQLLTGAAIATGLALSTGFAAEAFGSTETLLKSTITADPQSAAAKSRLAEYYLNQPTPTRLQAATDVLKDIRLEDCHDAATAIAKGDLLQAQGQMDAAIQWYQRGQAVDPTTSAPAAHLAALYTNQNRVDDAVKCYNQAILQHPTDPALRNDLGLLYAATNRPDQALEQFHVALNTDPDYVPSHINLANALIAKGQLVQAAAELRKAVSIDPQSFEAFHNAGLVLAQLHDYENAVRLLTVSVQLKPDSPQARNDLGVALTATGKYNRAIFEFEKAISLASDYDSAKHNLKVAQQRLEARQLTPPQLDTSN